MTDFCQIIGQNDEYLASLGAIQSRKFNSAPQPVHGFECSIAVADVDAVAAAVAKSGGTIVMPKSAIPGVGWVVNFWTPKVIWLAPFSTIPRRARLVEECRGRAKAF